MVKIDSQILLNLTHLTRIKVKLRILRSSLLIKVNLVTVRSEEEDTIENLLWIKTEKNQLQLEFPRILHLNLDQYLNYQSQSTKNRLLKEQCKNNKLKKMKVLLEIIMLKIHKETKMEKMMNHAFLYSRKTLISVELILIMLWMLSKMNNNLRNT